MEKKRCFVIMGFGIKTDFATGRRLDLNKSYQLLIKPVVEAKGLTCLRADEIRHSGAIDLPSYQELLNADLVIADLSTSNVNVFYELGIRHTLRRGGTIVISEDRASYPFDLNHIHINSYTHLGDAIDFDEVERFRNLLGNTIDAVLKNDQPDSPVYTFLDKLVPPSLQESMVKPSAVFDSVIETAKQEESNTPTIALLIEDGEKAIANKEFEVAKGLFIYVLESGKKDPYLIQRLVLATYRSEQPDKYLALLEARSILEDLAPQLTNDLDTLELLGELEFALFNETNDIDRLARARDAYTRLYSLSQDYQTGIVLAYIICLHLHYQPENVQMLGDIINANRIREEVIDSAKRKLTEIDTTFKMELNASASKKAEVKQQKFAIWCIMAEAYYSLGEKDKYAAARNEAALLQTKAGSLSTLDEQIKRLSPIVSKQMELLSIIRDSFQNRPALAFNGEQPARNEKLKPESSAPKKDLIFLSYSHQDKKWKDEIQKTLIPAFRNKPVILWDDEQILPGRNYRDTIKDALSRAKAAVLLVSRDFLGSKFIAENELPSLLSDAGSQGVPLMWILIEDCLYDEEDFEQYQALNNPSSPLSSIAPSALNAEIVMICKKIRQSIFGNNN